MISESSAYFIGLYAVVIGFVIGFIAHWAVNRLLEGAHKAEKKIGKVIKDYYT